MFLSMGVSASKLTFTYWANVVRDAKCYSAFYTTLYTKSFCQNDLCPSIKQNDVYDVKLFYVGHIEAERRPNPCAFSTFYSAAGYLTHDNIRCAAWGLETY